MVWRAKSTGTIVVVGLVGTALVLALVALWVRPKTPPDGVTTPRLFEAPRNAPPASRPSTLPGR